MQSRKSHFANTINDPCSPQSYQWNQRAPLWSSTFSAIFVQAWVYSRSLKVQHVCWTLPFKIARQMFRSFCEPLRRSCIKSIWMTNTTRMKTFYDAHAWVKMIRPICIRSLSISDCELYPYRGFAMNKSTLWHFGVWQLVERHFLQWIHICKSFNGWQLAKMKKSIPDMSLPWNL